MLTVVLFVLVAAAALTGALGVVLSRNPVHSALWLVLTLLSMAVFFVMQEAQLLAAVQVIVYAGAIVVLFLFVIMLLGVDQEETLDDPLRVQRPIALLLGVLMFVALMVIVGGTWVTGAQSSRGSLHAGPGGNIERVARVLFTDFLWPFELTAALLVVAVVGGVVLARRSRGGAADDAEEVEAA